MPIINTKRFIELLEDTIKRADKARDSFQAFGAELDILKQSLVDYKSYLRDCRFVGLFHIWQNDSAMHPFTCGNDSSHKLLASYALDGGLGPLRCYLCDYTQEITEHIKKLVLGEPE